MIIRLINIYKQILTQNKAGCEPIWKMNNAFTPPWFPINEGGTTGLSTVQSCRPNTCEDLLRGGHKDNLSRFANNARRVLGDVGGGSDGNTETR